jgi:hypothetical protein
MCLAVVDYIATSFDNSKLWCGYEGCCRLQTSILTAYKQENKWTIRALNLVKMSVIGITSFVKRVYRPHGKNSAWTWSIILSLNEHHVVFFYEMDKILIARDTCYVWMMRRCPSFCTHRNSSEVPSGVPVFQRSSRTQDASSAKVWHSLCCGDPTLTINKIDLNFTNVCTMHRTSLGNYWLRLIQSSDHDCQGLVPKRAWARTRIRMKISYWS